MTFEEVKKDSYRKGHLGIPYHYFIDCQGDIHKGRSLSAVAGSNIEAYSTTVAVLIDDSKQSRESKKKLQEELENTYKGVEIVEEH